MCSAEQIAFDLDLRLDLSFAGNDFFNYLGFGERWLRAANGDWVYVRPDGDVYQWNSQGSDTLLASLDSRYHQDLKRLYHAPAPAVADAVVSRGPAELLVDWSAGFVGDLRIEVTVNDRQTTRVHMITVRVW